MPLAFYEEGGDLLAECAVCDNVIFPEEGDCNKCRGQFEPDDILAYARISQAADQFLRDLGILSGRMAVSWTWQDVENLLQDKNELIRFRWHGFPGARFEAPPRGRRARDGTRFQLALCTWDDHLKVRMHSEVVGGEHNRFRFERKRSVETIKAAFASTHLVPRCVYECAAPSGLEEVELLPRRN